MAMDTNLLRLLETICHVNDKEAALAFLRTELRLWQGGCLVPTDVQYAGQFIPVLQGAVLRLEAAETVDTFLEGERHRGGTPS
jgi:hypothetical protein